MLKRKHLFSFAIMLLSLLVQMQLSAQTCTTQAGTIQPGTYTVCSNESITIPYNNDAVLEANDAQIFVLHDGTPGNLGNIITTSTTSTFSNIWVGPSSFQTYQVAVIAGDALFGWVDFNDPCLSLSGGATLTINPAPSAGISLPNLLDCNGSTSVVLNVNAFPQGIAYQYQWSGPVSDPLIKNPTTSTPGVYTVTVSNGQCSTAVSATVYSANNPPLTIGHSNFTCTPPATQVLTVNAWPYQVSNYLWSNGSTGSSVVVSGTGEYCATVTYPQGCTVSVCDTAINFEPTASIIHYNFGCVDSLNGLFVESNLTQNNPPLPTVTWEYNGAFFTSWSFSDPEPGNYNVTITNAGGCSATASYFVETSSEDCALLEGFVYGDLNSSCTYDSGDVPLHGIIVKITDAAGNVVAYAYTDEDGHWGASVEAGDYTISAIPSSTVWTPCPLSSTVTVGAGATVTQDFFMQPVESCSDLWVDIGSSLLRRCLSTGFYVNYCNNGTAEAENAYIELQLDPLITIDSAALPYTTVPGTIGIYRFDLGNVAIGTCDQFWITAHVSCNAVLGEALCAEVTAYPHAPCGPQAAWSGASLQITGECQQDSVVFTFTNVGIAPMTNALEYLVIEDAILMKIAPPPTINLGAGESYTLSFPADGSTWHVEASQEPNHPGNSMPSLTIEGCTPGQVFTVGYFNQFPLDDADPWVDEDCSVVVGSYDPNSKEGLPYGYSEQHQIERNTDLEYTIHFQNVGTDTAFTVVIRDTIAAWLNPATIRPGASSNPYKFDFYGEGSNIKFTFDNINLPDSAKTQAGSQGFVTYRIAQKPGVPFGTNILNNAAIYFDFNEPVITNTTRHLVDTSFVVTVSVWTPVSQQISLLAAPNPATDAATLYFGGIQAGTELHIELIDQLGRVCQSGSTSNATWTVNRQSMAAGVYTIRVTGDRGVMGTGKLIFK